MDIPTDESVMFDIERQNKDFLSIDNVIQELQSDGSQHLEHLENDGRLTIGESFTDVTSFNNTESGDDSSEEDFADNPLVIDEDYETETDAAIKQGNDSNTLCQDGLETSDTLISHNNASNKICLVDHDYVSKTERKGLKENCLNPAPDIFYRNKNVVVMQDLHKGDFDWQKSVQDKLFKEWDSEVEVTTNIESNENDFDSDTLKEDSSLETNNRKAEFGSINNIDEISNQSKCRSVEIFVQAQNMKQNKKGSNVTPMAFEHDKATTLKYDNTSSTSQGVAKRMLNTQQRTTKPLKKTKSLLPKDKIVSEKKTPQVISKGILSNKKVKLLSSCIYSRQSAFTSSQIQRLRPLKPKKNLIIVPLIQPTKMNEIDKGAKSDNFLKAGENGNKVYSHFEVKQSLLNGQKIILPKRQTSHEMVKSATVPRQPGSDHSKAVTGLSRCSKTFILNSKKIVCVKKKGDSLLTNQTAKGDSLLKNQTAIGKSLMKNQTAKGNSLLKNQTAKGNSLLKNQTAIGRSLLKNQTAKGESLLKNQTAIGKSVLKNQSPKGDSLLKNLTAKSTVLVKGIHETGGNITTSGNAKGRFIEKVVGSVKCLNEKECNTELISKKSEIGKAKERVRPSQPERFSESETTEADKDNPFEKYIQELEDTSDLIPDLNQQCDNEMDCADNINSDVRPKSDIYIDLDIDIKPDPDEQVVNTDHAVNVGNADSVELKVLKCKECCSEFGDVTSFDLHLIWCDVDAKKSKICSVCRFAFPDLKSINTHDCSRVPNSIDYTCSICKKAFKKRDVVFAHMKIHTKNREYTCEICQKSFLHKHHLVTHMKTHLSDRPFKCQVCSAAFKRRAHLQKHQTSHKSDSERHFKCRYCDWSFHLKYRLQRHEKKHVSPSESFICRICDAIFREQQILNRHMKNVHSDRIKSCNKPKRQIECEECGALFFWKKHLKIHMATHGVELSESDEDADDDFIDELDGTYEPINNSEKNTTYRTRSARSDS